MSNTNRSASPTQIALILIWWLAFAVNLGVVVYLQSSDAFEEENFPAALKTINTLYVPYLGMITAFYWARRNSAAAGAEAVNGSRAGNLLAVACSLLWNGMILFFMVRLLFEVGTIEDSLESSEKLGGMFVWLVGPALGYYFAKSGTETK